LGGPKICGFKESEILVNSIQPPIMDTNEIIRMQNTGHRIQDREA
jgi:hypothetical protein